MKTIKFIANFEPLIFYIFLQCARRWLKRRRAALADEVSNRRSSNCSRGVTSSKLVHLAAACRTDGGKAGLTFHGAYQRAACSMAATASCCLSYRRIRVHKRLSRWQPEARPPVARIDNISQRERKREREREREIPPLSCDFIVSET